ncbi:hypothetical protein B0J13DRAFT_678753 [Dactylonectria estremocensis]|uniref:BZIP domain-containing protein n=1 Tax=Dactylonectria estremocensis TaxID=1079267 RepID=A0A9P9IQT1_9HYPO|nr:hypothetical protein B0J13DRAFT_678753 [Dactylonectria estremocensis]
MSDPTPTRALGANGPRKRTRKVSHLTDEQIQQKRIVDRRAQRAFRQRTKDCISTLERQFAELKETCDQKENELQKVYKKNANLANCLEAVLDLVSTAVSENRVDLGGSSGSSRLHPVGSSNARHGNDSGSPSEIGEDDGMHLEDEVIDIDSNSNSDSDSANHDQSWPLPPPPIVDVGQANVDLETDGHHFSTVNRLESPCHHQSIPGTEGNNGNNASHVLQDNVPVSPPGPPSPPGSNHIVRAEQHPLDHPTGPSIATDNSHESHYQPCPHIPTPASSTQESSNSHTASSPPFSVLPSHQSSTCPLDQILLDFLTSQRNAIASGQSILTIVGPQKPTVAALIDDSRVDSVHPLSGIMSRVLSTFPFVELPERLAFFYLMSHTMRWQIHSTKENYEAMPSWLRPTVTQITTTYPMWIDNIPWPRVRDILIENPEKYPFQLFSDYYSQHVTINWKFDSLDAVADIENEAVLHSIFEKHIRKLSNWTVSPEFQSCFPVITSAIYNQE